jgi:hypothetical protein
MRGLAYLAFTVGAAALLSGCGAPFETGASGLPFAFRATRAAHDDAYLYIADLGLQAVIAFDGKGNKVAEGTFGGLTPVDVVTDSHGNVYVDVFNDKGHYTVLEYSHTLDHEIANYNPPGQSGMMTIDIDDNLYVEDYTGSWIDVAEFAYGSTKVLRTFRVSELYEGGAMLGMSARDGMLYVLYNDQLGIHFSRCAIASGKCVDDDKQRPNSAYAGFTTTERFFVYGGFNHDIGFSRSTKPKRHGSIRLPSGYSLPSLASLHSYESSAWSVMVGNGSHPAQAFRVDPPGRKIDATVGAGYLNFPTAAYYGNGFTP